MIQDIFQFFILYIYYYFLVFSKFCKKRGSINHKISKEEESIEILKILGLVDNIKI